MEAGCLSHLVALEPTSHQADREPPADHERQNDQRKGDGLHDVRPQVTTIANALGYQGDTVLNSLGDIFCCAIGFSLAVKLGWRWSLVLFFAVEAILLFWIRDSLLLEILMLIRPSSVIKHWQLS